MRFQMRQNDNVEFLNRKLRTNCLALLLATTRRDAQRPQEQTATAPKSNILALLLATESRERAAVTTRRDTPDDLAATLKLVA